VASSWKFEIIIGHPRSRYSLAVGRRLDSGDGISTYARPPSRNRRAMPPITVDGERTCSRTWLAKTASNTLPSNGKVSSRFATTKSAYKLRVGGATRSIPHK
jgi:hypothetical protein